MNNRALVPTGRNVGSLAERRSPLEAFSLARVPFALLLRERLQSNWLPSFAGRVARVQRSDVRDGVVVEAYSYAQCEGGRCVVEAAYDAKSEIGSNLHKMQIEHGGVVRAVSGNNCAIRKLRNTAQALKVVGAQTPLGIAKIAAVVRLQNNETYAIADVGRREQLRMAGQACAIANEGKRELIEWAEISEEAGAHTGEEKRGLRDGASMSDEAARSLGVAFANAHLGGVVTGGVTSGSQIFVNEGSVQLVCSYEPAQKLEDCVNEFFISIASLLKRREISWEQAQEMIGGYVGASPILRSTLNKVAQDKQETFVLEASWADGRSAGKIVRSGDRRIRVRTRGGYAKRTARRIEKFMGLL